MQISHQPPPNGVELEGPTLEPLLSDQNSRSRGGIPAQVGLLVTCLVGTLLVVWGLAGRETAVSTPAADGMGGPAEVAAVTLLPAASLTRLADAALAADPLLAAGTMICAEPGRLLPLTELGPVFRPDAGPIEMTIGRNQTFYEALSTRGVAHEDIMALVAACRPFRSLNRVRYGDRFLVQITADGGLRALRFDLDVESYVTWIRDGDTYVRHDGTYPVQYQLRGVSGSIDASLYSSLQKLNAPLSLAPKMSDILGWDIDFKRDLRQGDTFHILYEEVWKDGKPIRTGAVLAMEIMNRGKLHQAFLFETADGKTRYYDGEGNNMQKQLLRAPLRYSRISSGFSHNRLHPVLKRWMPHLGIDYAAPLGTPVKAGGDGIVVAATRKTGNGRYVQIRHTNSEYETYYLHLSRFAEGIAPGTRVTQGQVIGYVGASGYATGPHLDYRVKRNGKFVNPRKLKLPAAAPVDESLRPAFTAQAHVLGASLASLPLDASVEVPPLHLAAPPTWNGPANFAGDLPATVRALN